MAFTTAQRDALEAAIAQGAKRVKYADKEVEYNSMEEMLSLLDRMNADIAATTVRRRKVMTVNQGKH